MTSDGIGLSPGDKLRIERRYIVDGQLTCVTDEGKFGGIERVGSQEHLVLKDAKKGVRMFPLTAIAEITLVRAARRAREVQAAQPAQAARYDPSFA